jgi:hypothetical protein
MVKINFDTSSTYYFLALGGYELLEEKMRDFVVPDLTGCRVKSNF